MSLRVLVPVKHEQDKRRRVRRLRAGQFEQARVAATAINNEDASSIFKETMTVISSSVPVIPPPERYNASDDISMAAVINEDPESTVIDDKRDRNIPNELAKAKLVAIESIHPNNQEPSHNMNKSSSKKKRVLIMMGVVISFLIVASSTSVALIIRESKTRAPTISPSPTLSLVPSLTPSTSPTQSMVPSSPPSVSVYPSMHPSETPSESQKPSSAPSSTPSRQPSSMPSQKPSSAPSSTPSTQPSLSQQPSSIPTALPTWSVSPSITPSSPASAATRNFPRGGYIGAYSLWQPMYRMVTIIVIISSIVI